MDREPYRIIIVEDHASTAEALRKFLTTIGYKVYIAPDIASARGLAKAIEFDVLLSDLRLPDGTGWDLMEELSAMKPVRAIAISGHNTDVDVDLASLLEGAVIVRLRPQCLPAAPPLEFGVPPLF